MVFPVMEGADAFSTPYWIWNSSVLYQAVEEIISGRWTPEVNETEELENSHVFSVPKFNEGAVADPVGMINVLLLSQN